MKTVGREAVFYAFSADLEPALEVEPGEQVRLETHDCFGGQLQSEADTVDCLDWGHVNPATGPVYVRGARPGDILAVEIDDVRVAAQGIMVTVPGEGALGDLIQKGHAPACPFFPFSCAPQRITGRPAQLRPVRRRAARPLRFTLTRTRL